MIVILQVLFDKVMLKCSIVLHLVYDFIVDGHGVKSNDQSYYFGLYAADLPEKFEFPELGDGDALGWVSDEHALNNLHSLHAYVTW